MADHSIRFLEFLQTFRRGELLRQGDEHMSRLVEAMHETGGDGKLVIELPFKLNKAGQVECSPKLKSTIPQPQMGTGIYFIDDEQRLSRRDPRQMDIEDEIEARRARDSNL